MLPERVGVVGWGWGGGKALDLAANTPLQACVVCDGPVTDDPALVAGLRQTPVLGIFGGADANAVRARKAFLKVLDGAAVPNRVRVFEGAGTGFMGPPAGKAYIREAADRAFVEVYEFLGR